MRWTCIGLPHEGSEYDGKCSTETIEAPSPSAAAEDYFSTTLARSRVLLVSDGNFTHAFRYNRPSPTPPPPRVVRA